MHIILKDLLKEVEAEVNGTPTTNDLLKIQCYVDMDGVLVNMEKGFMEMSDGLTPKEYEAKNGKNSFWKLLNKNPTFWLDLDPMPDATVLWDFINDNFKNPVPVVLSAGQGTELAKQKTQWIRNHISPSAKVIISSSGVKKPEYTLNIPGRVTHVLIDDTSENINAWNNKSPHHIAILHKNAASSIEQLKAFLPE